MSHFSKVQTEMSQRKYLEKALVALGFELNAERDQVQVRGFLGDSVTAEFKVQVRGNYDIGFVRNESGSYEVVGDWEILPRLLEMDREKFVNKLRREYAKEAITDLAAQRGYEIECVEHNETETTEMVVTQW